ncbi:hypothetical protein [Bradyrhizobium sp. CCBAU 25338]|nr:hypothetical protein [Bradyrhizobium sp. CCBAU 25338]MDA9528979.1 hypothetical protein [Bradyrhizobium sp. CCBAU 25338]
MVDTQILVHMQAGRRVMPAHATIASVSAKEFLIMYGNKPDRDRYYVPLRLGRHSLMGPPAVLQMPAGHPFRRIGTDRLLIDFNQEHPSLVEFGSNAIASAINSARSDLFKAGVMVLRKAEQRNLEKRFRFLIENGIRCEALEENAVGYGLDILDRFLSDYAPKGHFRNTVCDALILGTAIRHRIPLQTEDKLLARLTAKMFGTRFYQEGEDLVIDFETPSVVRRRHGESKGYIHRGWRIAVDPRR